MRLESLENRLMHTELVGFIQRRIQDILVELVRIDDRYDHAIDLAQRPGL